MGQTYVEKWVTPRKMGQTWKNGSHSEKWVTFEKYVTVEKKANTYKSGLHLEKWVTRR